MLNGIQYYNFLFFFFNILASLVCLLINYTFINLNFYKNINHKELFCNAVIAICCWQKSKLIIIHKQNSCGRYSESHHLTSINGLVSISYD